MGLQSKRENMHKFTYNSTKQTIVNPPSEHREGYRSHKAIPIYTWPIEISVGEVIGCRMKAGT